VPCLRLRARIDRARPARAVLPDARSICRRSTGSWAQEKRGDRIAVSAGPDKVPEIEIFVFAVKEESLDEIVGR